MLLSLRDELPPYPCVQAYTTQHRPSAQTCLCRPLKKALARRLCSDKVLCGAYKTVNNNAKDRHQPTITCDGF